MRFGTLTPITFAAVLLLSSAVAFSQSGRQRQEQPAPIPIPALVRPSDAPPRDEAKISSLIVGGEISHDYTYYNSNYLDAALKEFANWMKYEPHPFLAVTRAGKMTFDAAKERAKRETGSHVLWLGIAGKDNGLGEMLVQYVDYSILMPSTGKAPPHGASHPGQASNSCTGRCDENSFHSETVQ